MRRPCVGKFIFEDDYVNITERENAADHWMDVLVVDDSIKKTDATKSYNGIIDEEEFKDNT